LIREVESEQRKYYPDPVHENEFARVVTGRVAAAAAMPPAKGVTHWTDAWLEFPLEFENLHWFGPNLPPWDEAERTFTHLGIDLRDSSLNAVDIRKQVDRDRRRIRLHQCAIMRDLVPYHPVDLSLTFLNRRTDLIKVARTLYLTEDFRPMSHLADVLDDAGCKNETILDHCRQRRWLKGSWCVAPVRPHTTTEHLPLFEGHEEMQNSPCESAGSVHVRGCWAIDALLGKS
jgi:hypothetical protein